jgi:integrase
MMTLYKREGSKFYWVRLERKGKVIQQSSKERTKDKAKKVEAELLLKHWPELQGGKEIPTLADFTKELYPYWTRELKAGTKKYYLDSMKPVLECSEIANARLDEIRPRLLEHFKAERMKADPKTGLPRISVATLQHSLRALRRALKIAADVFEYQFTPPKFKLRDEPKRDFVVDEPTFQKILEKCGRDADEQITPTITARAGAGRDVLQALYTVLYDCGLRAGEAVKLTWDRVNLEERWIFIDAGKTKSARRKVPLTSRVVTALSGLKEKRREGVPYVFTRYKGKQALTVGWASHEFGRIARLLNLPKGAVMHSLRHSFASRLGNKGCATADLMTLCGWESPQIAKRYTHLNEARMAEIVGFLEPKAVEAEN